MCQLISKCSRSALACALRKRIELAFYGNAVELNSAPKAQDTKRKKSLHFSVKVQPVLSFSILGGLHFGC
jgi:hypothetical protein